jgi:hypothetical protein
VAPHPRDEAITTSWDVCNVARIGLAITEHLAEGCDINPQIGLLHHQIWPCPLDQFALNENLARPFYKRYQDIKRSTANIDRPSVSKKQSLGWVQGERPELDDFATSEDFSISLQWNFLCSMA